MFRFSVLETKGDHLKANDDTEYKRPLFELRTRYADSTLNMVGDLEMGDEAPPIRFRMVMKDGWKLALAEEGL